MPWTFRKSGFRRSLIFVNIHSATLEGGASVWANERPHGTTT